MLASGIPAKFPIVWGASATYINTIPTTSQIGINPGYASLPDGFVPLNQTPVAGGGIPPRIQDMNGALNEAYAWAQWYQAGGPITRDSAFSTAISGYPKGAVVQAAALTGGFWFNTVDSNTTNPDTGGAGWVNFFAPVFVGPTFTGTSTFNGPLVMGAGQSASLGALATATTQAQGSNDTKLATDAYVDRQAASTLSTAETYAASVAATAQGNAETYAASVAATAQGNAETYAASVAATAQGNAEVYSDTQLAAFEALFGVNTGTNGYQKFPSGLIVQWGIVGPFNAEGGLGVSFPLTFVSVVRGVFTQLVTGGTSSYDQMAQPYGIGTSSMSVYCQVTGGGTSTFPVSAYWVAFGF